MFFNETEIEKYQTITDSVLRERGIRKIDVSEFFSISSAKDYFNLMDGDEFDFQMMAAEGLDIPEVDLVSDSQNVLYKLANVIDEGWSQTIISIQQTLNWEYQRRAADKHTMMSPKVVEEDFKRFDQKNKEDQFEKNCFATVLKSKDGIKAFAKTTRILFDYVDHLKRIKPPDSIKEMKSSKKQRVKELNKAVEDVRSRLNFRETNSSEINKNTVKILTMHGEKSDMEKILDKVFKEMKVNPKRLTRIQVHMIEQEVSDAKKAKDEKATIEAMNKVSIYEIEALAIATTLSLLKEIVSQARVFFFQMAEVIHLKDFERVE